MNKFRCNFNEILVKVIADHSALLEILKLTDGKGLPLRMVRWSLKLAEYNVDIEDSARRVKCCLIQKKEDSEFGGLYRYLEDPDGVVSSNAVIFERRSALSLIDW